MELRASAPVSEPRTSLWLMPLVILLFFAWGFSTVLVDTLIPKLKALFSLTYAEALLTQFCFFIAYFVMSWPASWLLSRIGYVPSIVAGLVVMILGCLTFAPAAMLGVYPGFLLALFVVASGITLLQVAANPLIALLGSPERAHSRLTFAQAFNSLGTTVGPLFGSVLILSNGLATPPDAATASAEALQTFRVAEAQAVQVPFLIIAAGLACLGAAFWLVRHSASAPRASAGRFDLAVMKRPRVALGALSIFVYVGAEVAIGSLLINYLIQPQVFGVDAARAAHFVSMYWGGAMVGRLLGGLVLRHVHAGTVLAACAVGACSLAIGSAITTGAVAGWMVIAIGLCNSIMFPTIFALGIQGLGEKTPEGSGVICMAIVGGAVIPPLVGALADVTTLSIALMAPAACYAVIAVYGVRTRNGSLDRPTGPSTSP